MTTQAIQWAREAGVLSCGHSLDADEVAAAERLVTIAYNAGLERAKQAAAAYGPGRPILHSNPGQQARGRWEGEQAASTGIANVIDSLKLTK